MSILITGASAGIGRAITQTLNKHDPQLSLVLTGRNMQELEKTLTTLVPGGQHHMVSLDVTDGYSLNKLKEYLMVNKVSLSGLVLNAGIGGENEFGESDRWDEIMATNLTGPYRLTQTLLPLIKDHKATYKNIVFVSSILARLGVPKYSAYCASKAGLLGLMRSMAAELAQDKILVNAICPGWVDTEMSVKGLSDMAEACGKSIDVVREEQMSMVPLKKMSDAREIGEMVQFLMSGVQSSMTGQTIDINNGALMP